MSLIRREQLETLQSLKDEHIIKAITGIRRCGKSTLLQMFADDLLSEGVSEKQIQILNFEDPDVLTIGDWKAVYDVVKSELDPDRMNYVFLDEVQNVKDFERLIDGLYIKNNVDLYVTGSNAYLLSSELATILTGRYIEIKLLPFSFAEYSQLPNSQNLEFLDTFRNFIVQGGFPQVVNLWQNSPENADEFIKNVLNTIIEKDIFTRNEIYTKKNFWDIVGFVFDCIGSEVSPNKIATNLKQAGVDIDSRTVTNYLQYLVDAKLIHKTDRYDLKGKRLLRTQSKYYLADVAFRRVLLGKSSNADLGHLLENIVYLELLRRNQSVSIGKINENEVDFVVRNKKGYTEYYQVAWQTMDQTTLERELKPLKAIKDSNAKFLLTNDFDLDPVYDGIRKYNVVKWLLGEYDV